MEWIAEVGMGQVLQGSTTGALMLIRLVPGEPLGTLQAEAWSLNPQDTQCSWLMPAVRLL